MVCHTLHTHDTPISVESFDQTLETGDIGQAILEGLNEDDPASTSPKSVGSPPSAGEDKKSAKGTTKGVAKGGGKGTAKSGGKDVESAKAEDDGKV